MPACFILNFLIKKEEKEEAGSSVFTFVSGRQWQDQGDLCAASSSLLIKFLSEGWASAGAAESNFN